MPAVSNRSRPQHRLSPWHTTVYANLTQLSPDSRVEISFLRAEPHNHQTENHVIDARSWWVKKGELAWGDLEQLRERPESIWINSDQTRGGLFDCISLEEASTLTNSLLLIKKGIFTVEVGPNLWEPRKKIFRGKFSYKNTQYDLSLTDPVARDVFSAKGDGDHVLEDVYLCLSLTEPFKVGGQGDGRCHKLVAAIIDRKTR